jgi:hypothetical protein
MNDDRAERVEILLDIMGDHSAACDELVKEPANYKVIIAESDC